MENFKALYLEYCKTYNADPQEAVRSELKRFEKHFILTNLKMVVAILRVSTLF